MSDRSEILYITASYPYGSAESFIEPEIEQWEARDRTVRIVPVHGRGALRLNVVGTSELTHWPLFRLRYVLDGLFWFFAHPRRVLSLMRDLLRAPSKLIKNMAGLLKAFAVAKALRASSVDHIHAHWGGVSSTVAMAVSRLTGIPWSLTCHRWDIYEDNLLALKSRDACFVRFISERGMRDAISLGADAEKCVVIHMGVKVPDVLLQRRKRPANPVLMCAANLLEVKGHRFLIEAMQLLRQRGFSLRLLLCGDGPLRAQLAQQCRDRGLEDVIEFLGHVPHDELLSLYRRGDVDLFVLPSIEMSDGHHEGIPVSLMEAMSYGVPVISTTTGSVDELLPVELGVTVPGADSQALADVIGGVLSSDTRYVSLSSTVNELILSKWDICGSVDALEDRIFAGLSKPISGGPN